MTVYRFKVQQSDNEELVRVIDIPDGYTLEHLHLAILSAINFNAGELASFYMSDEHWNKGQEINLVDMGEGAEAMTMADCKLNQMVSEKGDKLIYVYDFLAMWTFCLELQDKVKAQKDLEYPVLVEEHGEAPDQYGEGGSLGELSEEDEKFIEKLKKQGLNLGGDATGGNEEDDYDDDEWGDYGDYGGDDDLSDYPEYN